jgi:hypothetical protein
MQKAIARQWNLPLRACEPSHLGEPINEAAINVHLTAVRPWILHTHNIRKWCLTVEMKTLPVKLCITVLKKTAFVDYHALDLYFLQQFLIELLRSA